MKNNPPFSYWEKELLPSDCDVCIVGGGLQVPGPHGISLKWLPV
jgi:hypothetical protein